MKKRGLRAYLRRRAGTGTPEMTKLAKGQKGFSLLELVLAIALTGIITTAITTTIFQVFSMNTRTSNRMTALCQVQNAGKIVSEDILEAQNVTAAAGSGFPLALNWTDPATGNRTAVIYTLVAMPSASSGQLCRLRRSVTVTPPQGQATTTVSIVAEYIAPNRTSIYPTGSCSFPNCAGRVYNFTVTATVGRESETMTYLPSPRPGS